MNRTRLPLIGWCLIFLLAGWLPLHAQYVLPQDKPKPRPKAAPVDTTKADTTKPQADTTKPVKQLEDEETSPESNAPETEAPAPTAANEATALLADANKWVRRLLFRGTLDATTIGAYARYQITDWTDGVGSVGPVLGRVTIYYLGSSVWEGKDAEWLQAMYESQGDVSGMVEYDLLVPSTSDIKDIYRALYRIDQGELHATTLGAGPNELDYDKADKPEPEGAVDIKLYSGSYQTEKFHGSGFDGANVEIYRTATIPPMGIVRLVYGDQALTYMAGGNDAAPRFDTPPPPR
jgi:hypothetical protein